VFNFAPDGYLMTDSAGVIREANLAAPRLLERPRRYLPGKPVRVLVHVDDRGQFDPLLDQVHVGASVAAAELRLERSAGQSVPAEVLVNATWGPTPESARLRWLLRDLTERKAAEERVNRADRLAAVGQTVAAVGHESRRFLQRIQACLRMLRLEVNGSSTCLDLLDRAGRGVDDVARLFDDLRVGISRPRLRCGPCDLRSVWRGAWNRVLPEGRAIALTERLSDDGANCTGDEFRLSQVFENLFANSLAAGAKNVVITESTTKLNGKPAMSISIADDGRGLTPVERQRLFEPFVTTRADGTGLAAAVVKNIVEAHGGTVAVTDGPCSGTEIVLVIPREMT
jgi:PAS domain S-box-containing protein